MATRADRERVLTLRTEIARHNRAYYELDSPLVSDADYDALVRDLRALEAANPDLRSADSPTQRVSGVATAAFAKVEHRGRLLSLANAESHDELVQFMGRAEDVLGHAPRGYCVEWKLDGLSLALTYEHGQFVRAATRGDGVVGEDVTANVRKIATLPAQLAGDDVPELIEVRGEALMLKATFAELNAAGAALRNPRNAAAGSIRQKDPAVTASRRLDLYVYAATYVEGPVSFTTQAEMLRTFARWGLPVAPVAGLCTTIEEASAICNRLWLTHTELPFEVDGLVVKIDDLADQVACGHAGKDPRGAVARKYPTEEARTTVERIDVQIGRTGQVAPVAVLTPVMVDGTQVAFASLHNTDFIRQLGLRLGDRVLVRRAGRVIPEIVAVDVEARTGAEVEWTMPDVCPECGSVIVRSGEEAAARCPNPRCPGRVLATLNYVAGRSVLNIETLGPNTMAKLVATGLVHDFADLFALSVAQLVGIGLGPKVSENIIAAIDLARQASLARLLCALNIRLVAAQTAEDLAAHFGSLAAIARSDEAALRAVDGVGPAVTASLLEFFGSESGRALCDKLEALRLPGLDSGAPAIRKAGPLSGKLFVITGRLTRPRADIAADITGVGGVVKETVTKQTDYLVVGDDAGSKLERARKLGITVLDEAGLRDLLAGS